MKGKNMNKKWQIYQVDNKKVEEIINKYKTNKLLATILANKNIVEEDEIEKFLKPKRNDFYNPYEMPDMEIAVEEKRDYYKSINDFEGFEKWINDNKNSF